MREYVRLLFLLRLFLRVFVFSYPLFLTVMYNFWVFIRIPSWMLAMYIVLMGTLEVVVLIFSERLAASALLSKIYVMLAVFFEFPSAVVELFAGGRTFEYLPFLVWALPWYLSVFLIAFAVFYGGSKNRQALNKSHGGI